MKKILTFFALVAFLTFGLTAQDVAMNRAGKPKAFTPPSHSLQLTNVIAKTQSPDYRVTSGMATITLKVVGDPWDDGSGYQILLLPTTYNYNTAVGLDASTGGYLNCTSNPFYAAASYKLPTTATSGAQIVAPNTTQSVDITPGTYNYITYNPFCPGQLYVPNDDPANGGADLGININFEGYTFLADMEYVFTVIGIDDGNNDLITLTTESLVFVPTEIALLNLVSPVSGQNLTATEPVKVTLKNLGTDPINSVDLYLTVDENDAPMETYSTPIASGASVEYTFTAKADLSAFGTHSVIVTVDVAGDANSDNNKIEATITNVDCSGVAILPFEEKFEGTFPPTCWTMIDGKVPFTLNASSSSFFTVPAHDGNYVGINDDAAGNSMNNYESWMILPTFNFTTVQGAKLSIDYIFRKYGTNEKAVIKVSTNGGGTYSDLETLANSYPAWTSNKEISLDAYTGEASVTIAVYYNDGNGYNGGFAIDNIKIWQPVAADIALIELVTPPASGQNFSATEQVKVKVKNNGSAPITAIDFYLTVDEIDLTPSPEVWTGSIAPDATYDYTFTAPADLSAFGPHSVIVSVEIAGETNTADNKIEATITNVDCAAASALPFEEKFTNGVIANSTCWTFTNNNLNLGFSTSPTGSYFGGADGGILGYDDDGAGSGALGHVWAILPTFNFSTLTAPKIKFDYLFRSYSTSTFSIEYSLDGGPWQSLENLAATGANIWTKDKEISLIACAGASNVRIAFHYNDNNTYAYGAAIDNIKIWQPVPTDLAVVSLVAPVALGQNLTSAETVTVKVKNNGSAPITAIDFYLTVDEIDLTVAPEAWTGSIAPNASYDYTFTAKADLSAFGNHEIIVTADVAGDPTNDNKLTATVENLNCTVTSFPLDEDFQSNTYQCWTVVNTAVAENEPFMTSFTSDTTNLFFLFNSSYQSTTYDQYLISPAFPTPHTGLAYSLKYYYYPYQDFWTGSYLPESFEVGYSTTTADPAAFTWEVPAQTGTTMAWQELTGVMPANAKYFAIHYFTEWGQYTIFDDIHIYEQLPYDVAVTDITSPNSGVNLGEEIITVTLKNFGENPITTMNLYYTVGEENEVSQAFSGNIASGATQTFSFTQKADLSAYANQDVDIKVTAELAGDGNSANDSYTKTVHSTFLFPLALKWDFEDGMPTTFTLIKLDNLTAHNTTLFPNNEAWVAIENAEMGSYSIEGANPGVKCAISQSWTDPAGTIDRWMITPQISVNSTSATLIWASKAYEEGYPDGYNVKISTTDAQPASFIHEVYSTPADAADWTMHTVDLAQFNGQQIYIAFQNNTNDMNILCIDDIQLRGDVTLTPSSITENINNNNVSIYPNPAKNVVNIQVEETSFVKVYNVTGKLVDSFTATAGSNNAYQTVAGVYFFNINGKTYKVVFE
ncbi:hypothetical protein FACS1894180_0530 [Bacteroidia bacterium]|nr:hypothetical protein FACS1894178_4080 [Bacteroidia bacterium]GHV42915.1 hypothetical protein FACS1894180_0530 [Bacteroidia bacterium]